MWYVAMRCGAARRRAAPYDIVKHRMVLRVVIHHRIFQSYIFSQPIGRQEANITGDARDNLHTVSVLEEGEVSRKGRESNASSQRSALPPPKKNNNKC